MGQFSPIILAGLVAFLHCMRAQRRLIAGVSLFVLGIKPHLLIPVAIAVIVWSIRNRHWEIIAGLILAPVAALIATAVINPIALNGCVGLWRIKPANRVCFKLWWSPSFDVRIRADVA
jgi:predicted histidine transporter YuiF (NhaC family)